MKDRNTTGDDERKLAPVITWRTTLVTSVDCPTCKLVGLVLSLYMNERGGSAFPSVPTLAGDCSLTDRAVRKHLNEHLHVQGWLTLIERGGVKGQRKRANEWQASTPELGAGVEPRPRNEDAAPRNETTETPERGSSQVVQEQVHEVVGASKRICVQCGEVCDDLTAYQDHLEVCDPDFVPADRLTVIDGAA